MSANDSHIKNVTIACTGCDLLHRISHLKAGQKASCSRCGTVLYHKKKNSVERTLALSVTGLILFFIANIYPILTLKVIGATTTNTLMSGVVELYQDGLIDAAIMVFLMSILFPLIKLLTLLYVLIPIKFNFFIKGRKVAFRIYKSLDTWGMVDVYLLGIIVAFIKLADFASVSVGLGLYALIFLIIITISSSITLDDHLIWERLEYQE